MERCNDVLWFGNFLIVWAYLGVSLSAFLDFFHFYQFLQQKTRRKTRETPISTSEKKLSNVSLFLDIIRQGHFMLYVHCFDRIYQTLVTGLQRYERKCTIVYIWWSRTLEIMFTASCYKISSIHQFGDITYKHNYNSFVDTDKSKLA